MKSLIAVSLCAASVVCDASAVVIPVNCNLFFNGSNAVQIAWNCYPGKSYVVETTTNLAQPWQNATTTPPTLTTSTNWLSYSFPVLGKAQFFKVVRLDTDGPEVYKTSPFDGAIGVNPQATIQAWLRDDSGVNTNTIALTVGTNAPVSLKDPRLSYVGGVLTYTPGTNEFLGTNGQIMTLALAVADTLGNQTANFSWSFQLALTPVLSTNIVFLGGTNPEPCNLTLLSTNGDYFTFSYTGSCCLTNGTQLINTNLYTGYARTVVSLTNYPVSNTVVALTRQTTLAELLQEGTFSSSMSSSLSNSAGGLIQPRDLQVEKDFQLQYSFPLGQVLYQDANFLIETTPDSQLSLDASLQLAANFHWFKLTAIQAQLTGTASFQLDVHARAAAPSSYENSVPLITPIHKPYVIPVAGWPVLVDVVFELNAGYTADFSASAEITNGISASKTISVGRKWGAVSGWQPIFDNPPVSLTLLGPIWQVQGSADIRAYLQPKVSLLIYSLAGVSADLEPYLELSGIAQLNPPQWDLGLYAGLDSTIGLDLAVWDDSLGNLPSMTLNLIPQQTLWHVSGPPSQPTPLQITAQPQSQTVSLGSTVSFTVQAQGSEPLSYYWYKNGLYLTDDSRITGASSSALRIAKVQSSDAGGYNVHAGVLNSHKALLTVSENPPPNAKSGYALFSQQTDTIAVNGHTSVATQMTIEAEIVIPSSAALSTPAARIFEEQKNSVCDKTLAVWPHGMGGGAWTGWVNGTNGPFLATGFPVSVDMWHHVAFVRDGDEQRLYLDGNLIGTQELASTPYDLPIGNASDSQMAIGAFVYNAPDFFAPALLGGIQWVRVSGVARYVGSFATPPGSVPLSDSFTQLLFDFRNIATGTMTINDLSSNHFRGTVATGFPGATAPTFVPPP